MDSSSVSSWPRFSLPAPVLSLHRQPRKSQAPTKPYTPARTPWGDPDMSGVFTNSDESLIPFERPAQFEGRRLEESVD